MDVRPEHLFLGIVKTDDPTRQALLELGVNINDMIETISKDLSKQDNKEDSKNIVLSWTAEKIMKVVHFEVHILKQKLVEPYHILLSILREDSNNITQRLKQKGFIEEIRKEIELRVQSGRLRSRDGFFAKLFG